MPLLLTGVQGRQIRVLPVHAYVQYKLLPAPPQRKAVVQLSPAFRNRGASRGAVRVVT